MHVNAGQPCAAILPRVGSSILPLATIAMVSCGVVLRMWLFVMPSSNRLLA